MTYATKARTLDDIAADSHVFSIIAMDQRNTLRRMFAAVGLDASDDDLRVAKADVARVLTPAASGLLSDPTYGVPAITEAKALAPDCGLLVAAEPSERRSYQGEPRTHRDPALNAQWVLDQGGDALKFFGFHAPNVFNVPHLVNGLADIGPLLVTAIPLGVYNFTEGMNNVESASAAGDSYNLRYILGAIIESARALDDLDIDLLKLEYPGSPEGCRRLAAILHRPWAVLSAGVPFDQFTDIIRIAAEEGGASGFIAGRSVWREVVGLAGRRREEFLTTVALPRLERLIEVAEHRARPWTDVAINHQAPE